ncbi:MAG: AMIN-like domain-containing (lipo)protein [Sciscionella sp.]
MKHRSAKIAWRLAAILLTTLAVVIGVVTPASSAPKAAGAALLTNIRVGAHPTFDRVVLDLSGPRPTTTHRFVPRLIGDPSGLPVNLPCPVAREQFLETVARPASAFNDAGRPTYHGRRMFCTPSLRNIRAVGITGDFEAVLSVGVGMRHRSWVNVFTLANPTRVVIDVGR